MSTSRRKKPLRSARKAAGTRPSAKPKKRAKNLSLRPEDIAHGEAYSRRHGTKLSKLVGDFLRAKGSTQLGEVEPSYKPGVLLGDLAPSLPAYAIDAIREALPVFGRQIPGFDRDDAVLTGVETRTSSPVRITRDAESMQSLNTHGLYPCAEGAGYAGGILSAGVDGIKVAEAVARDLT